MSHETPVVFVVDDDISVRESLEPLICSAGWQPKPFESAQEFLSSPRVLVPNCLILDVNLPDLNGLDLQKLVSVERTDMPIIFVIGYGDVPMTVKAMKAGAVEFLMKPCPVQQLVELDAEPARGGVVTVEDRIAEAHTQEWRGFEMALEPVQAETHAVGIED